MWTTRILIGVSIALVPLGAAQGQYATAPSAPPPIHSSVVDSAGGANLPYVPAEVGKYRLTATAPFPDGSGVQFMYKNNADSTNVIFTPYDSSRILRTRDDTNSVVQTDVLRVRDPLELLAQQGVLQDYHRLNDRADNLHVGARTIAYYWYFAQVRQRGQGGIYLYYTAYALPNGLLHVRGELPWLGGRNYASGGTPVPVGSPTATPDPNGGPTNGVTTSAPRTANVNMSGGRSGSVALGGPVSTSSDANTFREQFTAFSNQLVSAMVTHPAATPPGAPVAPASVTAASATVIPAACTSTPPATDTINYRVYATLAAPGRKDSLPTGYVELVLDALRHSLVVPNPLGLTVYAEMISGQGGIMVPAVFGEVNFTLDDQGKVSDIHLTQSSLSQALDQSFFDAPRRADSVQAFPGQIGVTNPGKIRFYVSFSPFESNKGRSMPFFAVRMPAWSPGARPAIDPPRDLKPTFPVDARNAPGGDSVSIQFVVDDHGTPVKSTMRLLSANYIEYAQAVVDAALHSQYIPAMAAGCPVPGLLERTWRMTVGAQ